MMQDCQADPTPPHGPASTEEACPDPQQPLFPSPTTTLHKAQLRIQPQCALASRPHPHSWAMGHMGDLGKLGN